MHNAAYDALGLNWVYVPMPVPDQSALLRLTDAARSLSVVGFNVTMPYKQAMLSLCDEVAMLAQMAGAVNTVHCVDGQLIGYNTDGRGLIEALETEVGFIPEGKRVTLVGAGGAAAAAVVALVLAKASHINIINRDVTRAEALLERLQGYMRTTTAAAIPLDTDAEEAVTGADLVINATSVGLDPADPSPVPGAWFRPEHVACDMIYQQSSTAFLRGANQAGATTLGGLPMLVAQGALSVDIWSESAQTRTPRDVMRAAAEKAAAELFAQGGGE